MAALAASLTDLTALLHLPSAAAIDRDPPHEAATILQMTMDQGVDLLRVPGADLRPSVADLEVRHHTEAAMVKDSMDGHVRRQGGHTTTTETWIMGGRLQET